MNEFLTEVVFIFQRLDWLGVIDILLVTAVFFSLFVLMRDTQAVVLLRGVIVLIVVVALLSGLLRLLAFTWLLRSTLPALLLAIPVIFQPEIRRALERLGRASALVNFGNREASAQPVIDAIGIACQRLSEKRYGALIVIEREVGLKEYIDTGVKMDSLVTAELLAQIFVKDTPLHDGAVILRNGRLVSAACVLPLSTDASLSHQAMGLRHRAALGISEMSDAVAVIVSEQTGTISVTHNGKMIRRLDATRLRNILAAFYRPNNITFPGWPRRAKEEKQSSRVIK
ncbi:MAG TPA: diadenylate cyclase CdaA [Anaerolineales bacterium]|nr:diadenylate cyclase CdaA [Anaerolineales bacterium]HLF03096.1 diadenylate cyclase CdaA [Anaerolineales bacterium]